MRSSFTGAVLVHVRVLQELISTLWEVSSVCMYRYRTFEQFDND